MLLIKEVIISEPLVNLIVIFGRFFCWILFRDRKFFARWAFLESVLLLHEVLFDILVRLSRVVKLIWRVAALINSRKLTLLVHACKYLVVRVLVVLSICFGGKVDYFVCFVILHQVTRPMISFMTLEKSELIFHFFIGIVILLLLYFLRLSSPLFLGANVLLIQHDLVVEEFFEDETLLL